MNSQRYFRDVIDEVTRIQLNLIGDATKIDPETLLTKAIVSISTENDAKKFHAGFVDDVWGRQFKREKTETLALNFVNDKIKGVLMSKVISETMIPIWHQIVGL